MINSSFSHLKCFQCGSDLIFVSQETVQPEGSRYAQVNTVYRCSNDECQKKKDKEKVERVKQREKKEVIEKERIKKIQQKRQLTQKLKETAN